MGPRKKAWTASRANRVLTFWLISWALLSPSPHFSGFSLLWNGQIPALVPLGVVRMCIDGVLHMDTLSPLPSFFKILSVFQDVFMSCRGRQISVVSQITYFFACPFITSCILERDKEKQRLTDGERPLLWEADWPIVVYWFKKKKKI